MLHLPRVYGIGKVAARCKSHDKPFCVCVATLTFISANHTGIQPSQVITCGLIDTDAVEQRYEF